MPTMSWSRGSMVSLTLGACRGVLIYLAGALFSEAERRFNLELTHRLEVIGFDVFRARRACPRGGSVRGARHRLLPEVPPERRKPPRGAPHRHRGGPYRRESEPYGVCLARIRHRR